MKKEEFEGRIRLGGIDELKICLEHPSVGIEYIAQQAEELCRHWRYMSLINGRDEKYQLTKTKYSEKNLNAINHCIQDKLEEIKQFKQNADLELEKYRNSAEYHEKIRNANALKFAIEAGLHHDEHSSYERGDNHTLDVTDVVDNPVTLGQFHAAGKMLLLVRDTRTRRYAKSYSYGPSTRTDSFLVGENETGSKFAHAVPFGISTVEQAVSWIWGRRHIFARHGDVALSAESRNIARSILAKTEAVTDYRLQDNHVFTGEICKYANTVYVRAGKLVHLKAQHPDVSVPADRWYMVLIAKRSTRRSSSSD